MELHSRSDNELVDQFISGNQQAMEVLIRRHRRRVFGYILLLIKNHTTAEDVFQDTFVKVINSLKEGKYTDNGKFVSWVMRISHNLIIDHFRREKQLNTFSNDDGVVDIFNSPRFSDKNVEEHLVYEQILSEVRILVDTLPEEQKEVVLLRHYAGLSFKEIAEQTNVSINTALGRMRYALINMRKIMEQKNLSLTL
ncbi:MAG TPA: sigma-70 family RNA polymerase sigma factor [Tenuifilaceae bacterium]|nr:sigma-70 family RNA polymerase sigma factor [Bacteroidales bacterium]MDI9516571.1 sigma-70 family RNA polymerase sigma factor [Bacteroidota bacterium]OQC61811.1 MAG: RNA polymerase sigma factor CarQ [Bacteroidetes bacterium ADurb.Bin008]HNS29763.1 sigma-70 family RNA polymerase sigma factor [Tenuifilaceae bacterium]HNV80521.1 sigma-70 family RNA polymerase sigma factor [Tenuifilaceae bacterium]